MKIAVVLGTRPEIIKMSPVIRQLEKHGDDYFIVHTGQHYSYYMDRIFFEQLKLPAARYNLEVGSGSHGDQTARILSGIEKVFIAEKPDIVLVEGDTNTVLAGALAAAKLHIRVGHIEAGLRSRDWKMPEEVNRVLTDHCSDYLFAPTEKAKALLSGEGIAVSKIFITGNTIVDAIYQNLDFALTTDSILETLNLQPEKFFLVTIHRQENVDDPARFDSILQALDRLASVYRLPVVYPAHPRSKKMMGQFRFSFPNLRLIDPVDFWRFLQLEKYARLILTDSGGVQEESCVMGTPCVTLRDNTERPETLDVGASMIAGVMPDRILKCCELMMEKRNVWQNPFGDGKAGERIVEALRLCPV